jgi:exodeoxyribonuclease V gamma subunit
VLYIHRSERADALVDGLGELLREPLADVMQAEIVAVPSRGVERWLAQRVSRQLGTGPGGSDGVCANVLFPFPGSLVGDALSAASGFDPATDPWRPERAVWPLLEVVDAHLDEPWLAALAAHLRNAGPDGSLRRFATVRHIADLYDRYGVHRPEMLRGWAAGAAGSTTPGVTAGGATTPGATAGGATTPGSTTPEERWQAELWRRLRDRIGSPSPAERLSDACDALRQDAGLSDLPQRISLFGLTRLPASYLDVLAALSERRDVHLFLLHPSPVLWDTLAGVHPPRGLRRTDDPSTTATTNPLLSSWGRTARPPWEQPPCSAGSNTTSATTGCRQVRPIRPRKRTFRSSTAATKALRSMRVTAGPARSRSCATPCSTCSRTIPTSSPGTSW